MTTSPATRYSLLIRIQDAQNHAAWMEFVALYEPLVWPRRPSYEKPGHCHE